jgi:hypothetical protein
VPIAPGGTASAQLRQVNVANFRRRDMPAHACAWLAGLSTG